MANPLDRFDHVVVLMMENRSFDNMLGYLSDAPNFDGVKGKTLSNPAPKRYDGLSVDGAKDGRVFVSPGEIMYNPNPDPGEFYPHVNTQLFNCVAPTTNAYQSSYEDFQAPYNQPTTDPLPTPSMQGFVQDYYDTFVASQGRPPTRGEYSVIMSCFPPHVVPVISGLARHFAVCDHWHCAVPSQTFCNRSFFNAATSAGQVVNAPYEKWLGYVHKTIFNRLEDAGISWRIYFDEEDVFPLTLLIHFHELWHLIGGRAHHMGRFLQDAANGTLPKYSFLEPRLFLDHNDQHPPIQIEGWTQPSTVTAGEKLINEVYDAIRTSPADGTSNPENTLLMITYDEHGGCFDHVPPPAATPPGDPPGAGQMGFKFDRLGVRVPAVFVSAWTSPFNVVNETLHHTSLIASLEKKWGLEPLSQRDGTAPTIDAVFDCSQPRPASDWPVLTPFGQAPEAAGTSNLHHPLNELQHAIVSTVGHLDPAPAPAKPLAEWSIAEALLYMRKVRAQLDAM